MQIPTVWYRGLSLGSGDTKSEYKYHLPKVPAKWSYAHHGTFLDPQLLIYTVGL